MRVRVCEASDERVIFDWRNDPLTRQMSLQTREISWREHRDWFESAMTNPDHRVLICETAEAGVTKSICVVSFICKELEVSVSLNLSPLHRGKRWAVPCLRSAIDYYFELRSQPLVLYATIKEYNRASIATFEKVGFVFADSHADIRRYIRAI